MLVCDLLAAFTTVVVFILYKTDFLDIYYGKKTYAVYDMSALQWNRFVKDMCFGAKLQLDVFF